MSTLHPVLATASTWSTSKVTLAWFAAVVVVPAPVRITTVCPSRR